MRLWKHSLNFKCFQRKTNPELNLQQFQKQLSFASYISLYYPGISNLTGNNLHPKKVLVNEAYIMKVFLKIGI